MRAVTVKLVMRSSSQIVTMQFMGEGIGRVHGNMYCRLTKSTGQIFHRKS